MLTQTPPQRKIIFSPFKKSLYLVHEDIKHCRSRNVMVEILYLCGPMVILYLDEQPVVHLIVNIMG